MFGGIAVEKEIYAGKTAQISVCLWVGKLKPLGECPDTRYHIFDSVKYFFLVHSYALLHKNSKPSPGALFYGKRGKSC